MDIKEAQNDMRLSYLGGGPGALISGLVWLITGVLAFYYTKETSLIVFFLGGMLIHPMGILLSKLFNRTGKHRENNPLAKLAMESTVILFIGLYISYLAFQTNTDWFFPIMLMMIGVRYLIFQSIYGMQVFWILGLTLIFTGIVCYTSNQPFQIPAILGGIIELLFAVLIIKLEGKFDQLETGHEV